MIPLFPEFKDLELNDKEEFEGYTKKFEPYSDFNFISLWVYNTEDDTKISSLNNNLVIRFRDYITNEPFYTFLGINQSPDTAKILLEFSEKEGLKSELKLLPEICFSNLSEANGLQVTEDRDSFDYILSVEEIASLSGDKYHTHKNFVNQFHKNYVDYHISEIDLLDSLIQEKVLNVFYTWETRRNKNRNDTEHELKAIKKLLYDANYFDLISLGVYDKEEMVGFIISSLEQMDYAISHFTKADTDYSGVFYFLYHNLAKILLEKGYKYLNNEQDMGIPGLRKSKEQWNPTHYLKKYIITPGA